MSHTKVKDCFYLGLALSYPRDSVRVLTRYCTVLNTRSITRKRVSPAPPVPAHRRMTPYLPNRGNQSPTTKSRRIVVEGEGVDEVDHNTSHLDDLHVTWRFDLDAFVRERRHQSLAASEAGDGTAETIGLSEGGTVDARSAPARRAYNDASAASTPDTNQGTVRIPPWSCWRGPCTSSSTTGDAPRRQYGTRPGVRANA